jgi:hypothetical protein
VVSNFLERYKRKRGLGLRRGDRYRPTEGQLAVMSTRRTRLEARIGLPETTEPAPSMA